MKKNFRKSSSCFNCRKYFLFLCGLIAGASIVFVFFQNQTIIQKVNKEFQPYTDDMTHNLYNASLSDFLFKEIKILCWVFTHPENHKTKAVTVKNTWGKRCNKLLFMSTESDPEINSIALPVGSGKGHLWNKTKATIKYVYERHINDYDWFFRADDDNFILVENLRYMLYQYRPQTSLYIGHRLARPNPIEGFMTGGGHIMSKKAMKKLVEEIFIKDDPATCHSNDDYDGFADDLRVGQCLGTHAIFVNELDELDQKRFFPTGVSIHMKNQSQIDPTYWYMTNLWYNVSGGSLKCCSDTFIMMHYTSPMQINYLEYLSYNVHPFGYEQNLTESLPRKLTLNEIIERGDAQSYAKEFREHERIHNIDDSERFK